MNNKLRKNFWEISPFYFIWGFYSLTEGFLSLSEIPYMTDVSALHSLTEYLTIAMLLLMLIGLNLRTLNRLVAYIAFAILIFFIEVQVVQKAFLIQILFMMCYAQKDFDKFVSFDLKIKIFVSLTIFALCGLGVLNNYIHITDFAEKQALGFSHPNIMSAYVQAALLEWLYLRYKKMKWYEWGANIGIWLVIYKLAASRTTAYTYFIIYLLFILARVTPKIMYTKVVKYIFTCLMPVIAAVSFIGVSLYNKRNAVIVALDAFTSRRFSAWARLLQTYGVSLFGQEVEVIGTRTAKLLGVRAMTLDNAYFYCVLRYGIIYFILLCALYIYIIYYAMCNRQIQTALVCVYYIVAGLGESIMMNPIYNIMLLCLLSVNEINFGRVTAAFENRTAFRRLQRRNM